jgi:hypothetical protein
LVSAESLHFNETRIGIPESPQQSFGADNFDEKTRYRVIAFLAMKEGSRQNPPVNSTMNSILADFTLKEIF